MITKRKRPLGRPPRSSQKEPTMNILIQGAIELFISNGYQNVSVNDVAKKCNVTKATVYYYFDSKAHLYTEAMASLMLRIHHYMEEVLAETSPLQNRLHKLAYAHLQATVNVDLTSFDRETKNILSVDQMKTMQQLEEKMYSILETAFAIAIEKKEIPEVNPTFAAHAFLTLLKVGNYRNERNQSIFPTIEETTKYIIRFFWNGLSTMPQNSYDAD